MLCFCFDFLFVCLLVLFESLDYRKIIPFDLGGNTEQALTQQRLLICTIAHDPGIRYVGDTALRDNITFPDANFDTAVWTVSTAIGSRSVQDSSGATVYEEVFDMSFRPIRTTFYTMFYGNVSLQLLYSADGDVVGASLVQNNPTTELISVAYSYDERGRVARAEGGDGLATVWEYVVNPLADFFPLMLWPDAVVNMLLPAAPTRPFLQGNGSQAMPTT